MRKIIDTKPMNDLRRLELKGKVRFIKEFPHIEKTIFKRFKMLVITPDGEGRKKYLFNKNGNLISEESYLTWFDFFVRSKNIAPFRKASLLQKNIYNYDKNDFLYQVDIFEYGKQQGKTLYKYNDLGSLIEEVHYIINRLPVSTLKTEKIHNYLYDHENKLIGEKETHFFESGNLITERSYKLITERSYKYDKRGYQKEIKSYDTKYMEPIEIVKQKFNNLNQLQESYTIYHGDKYYENEKWHLRTFKYDENGNIIEETHRIKTSDKPEIQEYIYDNEGNIIEDSYYPAYPLKKEVYRTRLFYDYDYKRNWVRKTIYLSGKILYSVERKIKYYYH